MSFLGDIKSIFHNIDILIDKTLQIFCHMTSP